MKFFKQPPKETNEQSQALTSYADFKGRETIYIARTYYQETSDELEELRTDVVRLRCSERSSTTN